MTSAISAGWKRLRHAGSDRKGPLFEAKRACLRLSRLLLMLLAALGLPACDLDIDPDSLVRELRVLGIRFGEPTPASEADILARITLGAGGQPDAVFNQPQMKIQALAVAPTGPGRRVTAPRTLRYDWFLCIGPLSLFSPGVLDPECRKLGPKDPPARMNRALRPLVPSASTQSSVTLDEGTLKSILMTFLQALLSPGSQGGSGGMITLPTRPVVLLLPILVEVTADGADSTNSLDREVAFNFLRVILTLPGMDMPPANRNPSLAGQGGFFVGSNESSEGMMAARDPLMACPLDNLTGEAQNGQTACARFAASRTAPVFFQARTDAGALETYVPIDDSGRGPQVETMRYSWFSTDGAFSDERTGDKSPETKWENGERRPAPTEVRAVDVWVVVQDGRGGTDFARAQLSLM